MCARLPSSGEPNWCGCAASSGSVARSCVASASAAWKGLRNAGVVAVRYTADLAGLTGEVSPCGEPALFGDQRCRGDVGCERLPLGPSQGAQELVPTVGVPGAGAGCSAGAAAAAAAPSDIAEWVASAAAP